MLDITSLNKTLGKLEKSLDYCHSEMAQKDHELFLQFRAAAIQAFEYTYELSVKMIRRHLQDSEPSASSVSKLGFKDLIRLAAQRGLIDDPIAWFKFRDHRNLTSHTYEESKADDLYKVIPSFIQKVAVLVEALESS